MVRVKFSETFFFFEGVSLGSKNLKLTWSFERAFMTVHGYIVVNFSQIIFSFLLLLWTFSFVLHSLPSITTKES